MPFLFITSLASTNPVRVRIADTVDVNNLRLQAYSITGVPVTAGVPDNLYYNLLFQGVSSLNGNDWIRSDGLTGKPLALSGSFTHEDLNEPLIITDQPVKLQDFEVKLTDTSGNNATFTSFALWLEYNYSK